MHEHHWKIQSEHSTSAGTVTYSHCPCGAHTMRLREATGTLLAAVVNYNLR